MAVRSIVLSLQLRQFTAIGMGSTAKSFSHAAYD